jgi:hypothetical protein
LVGIGFWKVAVLYRPAGSLPREHGEVKGDRSMLYRKLF